MLETAVAPLKVQQVQRQELTRPGDGLLYAGFAIFALATLTVGRATDRVWAVWAAPTYVAAALTCLLLDRLGRRTPTRAWLAALVIGGALIAPLAQLILTGHAKSEVAGVERAAAHLLGAGAVYPSGAELSAAVQQWGYEAYFPYLPVMALFGIPDVLTGGARLADPRVAFSLAYLGCLAIIVDTARRENRGRLWLLLAASPLAASPLVTGGDDLPVVGLMLCALVLASRDRSGWAGFLLGLACAAKALAWPLLPVLVAATFVRRGSRAAAAMLSCGLLAPVLTLVPMLVVEPSGLVTHVLRYPTGLESAPTVAASPLPGYLLAHWMPGGRLCAIGLLLATAAAMGLRLLIRPPRDEAGAAKYAALGLTLATLLAPGTRTGYLMYPLMLVLVAWYCLGGGGRPQNEQGQGGRDTSLELATSPR